MQVWRSKLRNVDHVNKITKKLRLFSLAIRIKNNIYYGQPNIQNYTCPIGQVKKKYYFFQSNPLNIVCKILYINK